MEQWKNAALAEILSNGWIKSARWEEEVDSTNDVAKRYLHSLPPSGLPALFVADQQIAGRGRSRHTWWSPHGCLMFTLAVEGDCLPTAPAEWGQLALVCGVATAEAVGQFVADERVQLKWPNDVYVDGRKLAGILIESIASPVRQKISLPYWLIGIGLNVALPWAQAPQEIANRAICLSSAGAASLDPGIVLVELVSQLHHWLSGWQQSTLRWSDRWHERCLLSGRVVRVRIDSERQIVGRCQGVDSGGRLLVRDETAVHLLSVGEILSWD
jgi:BirA family biotin operon repressor/biotin-[acetyl-CoA-carboxylase] ligase